MKVKIIRTILIVLLLCTFGIIFGFSSQNSTKSSGISGKITIKITSNIKSIQEKNETEKAQILHKVEHIIRKIAHFSIYTVVGLLLMLLCKTYNIKELDRIAICLIIGIIYATSDEIHQVFVPGRGPLFTDVLIDSMGVTVGMLIGKVSTKIYEKYVKYLKKIHNNNIM